MGEIRLYHPIHTLDNKELLPEGSVFSIEEVDTVISPKRGKSPPAADLFFHHKEVYDDMEMLLKIPPYDSVFRPPEVEYCFSFMNDLRLAVPVLQTIDYFKENDFYTYRHLLVVFALTTLLVEDLIEDKEERDKVLTSGPSHDIGKICVPLSILKKKEPLTSSEYAILKQHSIAGYTLLCYYLRDPEHYTAGVALNHHERRDGSGYPQGKNSIDIVTEIIAVCDVYDALVADRPYRKLPFTNRAALEEITEMALKGRLGMDVVKALIARNRSNRPHYKDVVVSTERRGGRPEDNFYGVIRDGD